jgi:GcrA cell cycle regulator
VAKELAALGAKNMLAVKHAWTAETIELLKSRLEAGLSCREIAHEFGVTRNSIIGKISRLKLSRPMPPNRTLSSRRAGPKFRRRTQILMLLNAKQQLPTEETLIHSEHHCSLFDLTPAKCRWPINNLGTEDFLFCGNRPVEGLPYCARHTRIAYRQSGRQQNGLPWCD